jgi:hypothetical protein
MLREGGFSRTHITGQDDTLRHLFWTTQDETKEFHQKAVLRFSVGKFLRNVVYVKL